MRLRRRSLSFAAALCLASAVAMGAPPGSIVVKVTLEREGRSVDPRGLVVYLADVPMDDKHPAADGGHPLITQENLSFTPSLTVVPKGATIEFPNSDKVFHNVFSISAAKKFDLGLYKSGASKAVTFDEPGTIDVFCNIHPQMIAKILVVDSVFVARPGSEGAFALAGVPPGEHTLIVWQPAGEPATASVRVRSAQASTVELKLIVSNTPPRHLRKDGTPYGRYK